jgi:hypothetical protein
MHLIGHSETRQPRSLRAIGILWLILLVSSASRKRRDRGGQARPCSGVAGANYSRHARRSRLVHVEPVRLLDPISLRRRAPTKATRSLGLNFPLAGSLGADTFRTSEGLIIVGALDARHPLSLDGWTARVEGVIRGSELPTCAKPAERGAHQGRRKPGPPSRYPRCDCNYTLWVPLIHNRQAFIIWWLRSRLGS